MKPRARTVMRGLKTTIRALEEVIATAPESRAALLRIESARLAEAASVLVRVLQSEERP